MTPAEIVLLVLGGLMLAGGLIVAILAWSLPVYRKSVLDSGGSDFGLGVILAAIGLGLIIGVATL